MLKSSFRASSLRLGADLRHGGLPTAAGAQAAASLFEAQAAPLGRDDVIHGSHQANASAQHHATDGAHLREMTIVIHLLKTIINRREVGKVHDSD